MTTMVPMELNEGVDGSNPLTQPVLPPSCLNPLADGDGDDDQDDGRDGDHDEDIEDCDHYGEHDDMMLITVWMLITVTIVKGEDYVSCKYFRLCVTFTWKTKYKTHNLKYFVKVHISILPICVVPFTFSVLILISDNCSLCDGD